MRAIVYILMFFCLSATSQTILRVSQSGKVYGKRLKFGGPQTTASIVATDNTATEETTTTGTWTVTLSNPSIGTTNVNYTIGGTATNGSDFTTLSGSVAITDGNTTGTITLTPIDDMDVEGNETVILYITSGSGYQIGSPSSATVTITDNDSSSPFASIASTDPTAEELASPTTGQFTVTLTSASVGTTTINYTVSGTATSGSDYTSIGTSVDITNGNTSATITVTPINDATEEGSETVIVTLASGTGYTVESPSSATVTILDDDSAGNPNFFAASPSATAPSIVTTYTPTSSADVENAANADKIAIISNSFSCTGCTFASGQIIRPAGGVISGTNINLNGAYIEETADQAFSPTATFSSTYEDSWVYPELFGAVANDGTDDYAAIEAGMRNVKFFKNVASGLYLKNDTSFVNRTGQFIWDLNGGRVEITNDDGYDETTDQQSMFWMLNISPKIFNGTIDGNGQFGRCITMAGPEAYHFEDLTIEFFHAPNTMRGVAIQFAMWNESGHTYNRGQPFGTSYAVNNIFSNGYMNNVVIDNISSDGDCSFNNTIGVTKGFWMQYEEIDPLSPATIYHSNNTIQNILGEDAEGVYFDDGTFGSGPSRVNEHLINVTMFQDTIRQCNRRALKATQSNITLNSCVFESAKNDIANTALASLVDFFVFSNTTYPTDYNNNINILNCTFREPEDTNSADVNSGCGGSVPDVPLLRIGDTYNVTVTGNTFDRPDLDNYQSISIGSSASPGKLRNALFSGNTFYNAGYQILPYFTTDGFTNTIQNETFYYDITTTGGASTGVIKLQGNSSSMAVDGLVIDNIDVNIINDNSGLKGFLYSNGADITNWDVSNVLITYTTYSSPAFAEMQGDVDSSNTFDNCDIVGASATNGFVINGTVQNPVITNSTGDGGTTLTVQ